ELEIVDDGRFQYARQIHQSVLRNRAGEGATAADIGWRQSPALIPRIAHIYGMAVVEAVVQTHVAEIFVDIRRQRTGNNVLKRVHCGNLAFRESRQKRLDGRHSLRARQVAEGALTESNINALE